MLGIEIAKKYIGLDENQDTQEIMNLLESKAVNGDITINPAKTSWCAAWINFCERSVGNPGTGALNAQSFNTYGKEINQDDAVEGDILVMHFAEDAGWQGHVTYFVSWDDNANTVKCLGGNQSNEVRYSDYSQDAIKHARRYE